VNRGSLRAALERLAFTSSSLRPGLIGAEVEMLVADAATGMVAPIGIHDPDTNPLFAPEDGAGAGPTTLGWLRPLGARHRWVESCTSKGVPCFRLQDGATIGFEPGGQLEYSTAPHRSASALLRNIESVIGLLHAAAGDAGAVLRHVGIDPTNPLERVPLQLAQPRYARMDTYLASRGDSGRRMMRQTAAIQVAVDLGAPGEMLRRWRVLNAAVPYVVAAFANSPCYAGSDTGAKSYRAQVWRMLDASRTGILGTGTDPVGDYLDFALAAPAMFHPDPAGCYEAFQQLAARGAVTEHDWEDHLSTLFPEVRPRGYFEVRSADSVPLQWLPALFGTISAVAYDSRSTAAALDLLPDPDAQTLTAAGRVGLDDPRIASRARDLLEIALQGCARLGDDFLEPGHREQMRTIVEHHTARRCSPASRIPVRDFGATSVVAALRPPR
jgi:glutamate--cysteine ligase